MTSLLRELVPLPKLESASTINVLRPDCASRRATARPMTPAPTTTASTSAIDCAPQARLERDGSLVDIYRSAIAPQKRPAQVLVGDDRHRQRPIDTQHRIVIAQPCLRAGSMGFRHEVG